MKKIKLKRLFMQNFKGCREREVNFADKTDIYGANATGKTTLLDAFMWCLFDKDSTGASKFQIRPLDSAGKRIDNVEIVVELTLEIDGKIIILSKTQKQKWVKRRGSDVTELQGNENLFEINDYPKSEKEFKDFVSGIIDEELFKLITNPQAFASMPWKKQREVLMNLVDEVSDLEIAQQNSMFNELIPELEMASTEDIRKKYTKALNTWKKKQIEIPARIDEASKQIVDIDVSELELQRNVLKEQISETEKMQSDSQAATDAHDKAYNEVVRIKGEMRQISEKAEALLADERRSLLNQKDEAQRDFNDSRQRINMCELIIKRTKDAIERKETEKKELQNRWKSEKARVFREYEELPAISADDLICPTCGQELSEEQKQLQIENYEKRKEQHLSDYLSEKSAFEKDKKETLEDIAAKGNAKVEEIKKEKAELEQLEADLIKAKEDSMKLNKLESELMEKLNKLPVYPDLSENQEYEALELELSKATEYLNSMSDSVGYQNQLKTKLSRLREDLEAVTKKIVFADNSKIEKRIEELEEEQRDVGQKVADQEKMLDLLEKFIRTKMDSISNLINEKFNTVSWKLFDMQINGGLKECCECTVNGVPYTDLNNGHKIIAGLDIITSLCELFKISAPVFVDNAESINNYNIPEINGQMILLRVSDDKELRVEV